MNQKAQRYMGIVAILVGLIGIVAPTLGYSPYSLFIQVGAVGIVITGLILLVLPKPLHQRQNEKIAILENRIQQLERERRKTP